jgi:hypothetical protein
MTLSKMMVVLILVTGGILQTACADDMGPLQVQNRFPLHLMFLTPMPAQARPLAWSELQASIAFDYSSVFLERQNDRWDVLLDMELAVVDLQLAYGLTQNSTIQIDIPFASMSNGILDGFLQSYHDALNVGNYGRQDRPDNQFAYEVSTEGMPWLQGQSGGFHLSDLTVSARFSLPRPNNWQNFFSAVWVRIQLPTGDTRKGLGNGRLDYGLYLPVQWSVDRWSFYLMPGVALLSNPKTAGADVAAKQSISMFAGTAYRVRPRLNLNGQINFYASPIGHTGIAQLDDGSMELALGLKYRLSEHWITEFAFCEDLTRAAPDFTVHLGFRWQFSWHTMSHSPNN